MGVVRTGESSYDKEMDKWDTPRRLGGMKPDGYEAFPAMLYKAFQLDNGKWAVNDPFDENWSRRCQMIVRDDRELRMQMDQGWRQTPADALAYAERLEEEIANAAAERHYADQRLSDKARREAADVDASTNEHVPDIAAPKKRGRPTKQ